MDTHQGAQLSRRKIAALTVPIVVWSLVAVGVAMLLKDRFIPSHNEMFPIAMGVFVATVVRYRVWRAISADVQKGNASEKRFRRASYAFVILLIIFGRGGYVSWSCPHGWARGVMGVGIAWSPNGGPCRNTVGDLESKHVIGKWYVWLGTNYY